MGRVSRGSGDVFTDMGFTDAPERRTKLRLAQAINAALAERAATRTSHLVIPTEAGVPLARPRSGGIAARLHVATAPRSLRSASRPSTGSGRLAPVGMTVETRARRYQATAAALLGINESEMSTLANYRLDGFSVERLLDFLIALGRDVSERT